MPLLAVIVPTLAVGWGAVLLLRREQARITEQSARAQEGLRSAAEARARLIVENAELLAGDVQTLLLDTLAEQPASDLDVFLEDWSRTNPLVRSAFRARANGELVWPRADAIDQEARDFLQRFGVTLRSAPPWGAAKKEADISHNPAVQGELVPPESYALRQQADNNVRQVQSTRQSVQQMLRSSADASNSFTNSSKISLSAGLSAEMQKSKDATSVAAAPAAALPARPLIERRDWSAIMVEGRSYLLGWVDRAGDVRGVEVETTALVERLKDAMPSGSSEGEVYELQAPGAAASELRSSRTNVDASMVRVPLATRLLPGWSVVVRLADPYEAESGVIGASFLFVSMLLLSILVGGLALLWHAKRSMEEAAQKTSFVANVSHEFKTPLTTIRLYSELLEQGRVRSPDQGREYLRIIGRETQRLARLVNNALDFSRLEQGKKKYAREMLDLGTALSRLLDVYEPRLVESGLALRRELPVEPVSLRTDHDAVEQIILNLLDNSCKYANEGREVTVSLSARTEGGVMIRVSDRGPGVPADQRERIFEKFHRLDEALTAEKTGTGLGLSIARQLARGLGGELRCVAREGGGAEFILTLA